MRIAIIENGVVATVVEAPAPTGLAGEGQIAVATETAGPGWTWNGSAFTPPAVPPPSQHELAAYAADKRWRVASGGLVVPLPGGGALSVPSDDTAYGRLKGAAEDLAAGIITEPITIVLGLVKITATQAMAEALYAAIGQHWQACYATQGDVVDGIVAGTITSFAQIDAAAWPSNG